MYQAFMDNDFPALEQRFIVLFDSIANDNYSKNPRANYEGYYAAVMYAYLCSLGIDTIAEDTSRAMPLSMMMRLQILL